MSEKFDSFDDSVAAIVRSDIQPELKKEREVGFVKKDFGNKYNYHEGVERNWAAGINGNGHHVEMNFGGRYIENQLTGDSGMPDISGINGSVSATTLAIKTVGDEARYNEGDIDSHHKGDKKHVQTGSVKSEITGDISETITGNITKDVTGDVTENITGAAEAITKTLSGNQDYTATIAGNLTETSTIAGNYSQTITAAAITKTITGSLDWIKSAESQLVLGAHTDNFIGLKVSNSLAAVSENFSGAKISCYAGPKIDDKKIYIRKSATTMDKGETFLTNYKFGKLGFKLTMIG